jgi:hypothetical protein
MRRPTIALLTITTVFSWRARAAPPTIESRLAELARVLGCGDGASPDPERDPACLVALHWSEAKADPLPLGDTALVGLTVEVPDARAVGWRPVNVPAVGGFRVAAKTRKACEMDAYGDNEAQRAGLAAVKAPLLQAFHTLDAAVVVPAAIADEARERPAGAVKQLTRRGGSWTTRFQSAVALRQLGNRWFLIEERKGDSGLWISVFTSEMTVAKAP